MSEGADSPDVNFLVVFFANEDLWGEVKRSSTDGRPKLFGFVDGPSKITNFSHSLNKDKSTMVKTIFSSLMSLWMMSF